MPSPIAIISFMKHLRLLTALLLTSLA